MSIKDLPIIWLEVHASDRANDADKCERAYEMIQSKDTHYARGIARLAQAHREAALIYANALEEVSAPEWSINPIPAQEGE